MEKQLKDCVFKNSNYWCIDKNIFKKLGASTTILLMEYISLYDQFKTTKFYRSRTEIEEATGIKRNTQFKKEKTLVKLKLIKTKTLRSPATKTLFTIYPKNIKKFFKKHVSKKYMMDKNSTKKHVSKKYMLKKDLALYNYSNYNIYYRLSFKKQKERHSSCFEKQNDCPDRKTLNKKTKSSKLKIPVTSTNLNLQPANPYCKYSITELDWKVYNKLVELGATKHKNGNKAQAYSLDCIHRLITNCTNPYNPIVKESKEKRMRVYLSKNWTSEELVETFKFYLESKGGLKYGNLKSIGSFIYYSVRGQKPFSLLVKYHLEKYSGVKEEVNFNGTAKKIINFIDKKTGKANDFGPGLYIKTGKLLDTLTSQYSGNPNLLPPENDLQYQFNQFLGEKLNRENFKIPFMCSENFIMEFVDDARSKGRIVDNRNLRRQ